MNILFNRERKENTPIHHIIRVSIILRVLQVSTGVVVYESWDSLTWGNQSFEHDRASNT